MNSKCTNCGVGLEIDDSAVTEPFNCPACGEFNDAPMAARAPAGVRIANGSTMRGGASSAPSRRGSAGNVLAALASFVVPGLGQMCQGRLAMAVSFCGFFCLLLAILVVTGFPLVLLGAPIACVFSAIDAAMWKGTA